MGEQHLLTLGRPNTDPGRQHIAALGEAVGRRRRVTFKYHTVDANRTEERNVQPFGLGLVDGNWHLVGYDEDKGQMRNFRLDRIRGKVKVTDKQDDAYEVPADFDINRYVTQEEFDIGEGPEVEVTVEFDEIATWLLERRRMGSGSLEVKDDGKGLFTFKIRNEEGFFRWVAEFGQRAKIGKPKRLADLFRERMSRARSRYATAR